MVRHAEGLAIDAAESVSLCGQLKDLPATQEPDPRTLATALDFDNLLLSAEATMCRRGGAPVPAGPNWLRSIVVSGQPGRLELSAMPLLAPSPAVAKALRTPASPTIGHFLKQLRTHSWRWQFSGVKTEHRPRTLHIGTPHAQVARHHAPCQTSAWEKLDDGGGDSLTPQ